ncbi:MAG: endo-1,4-beta-xylanase [Clostridia bacterium]|nr:endo-1,4-beta-xylanase [Clostridia bacterium]
MASDRRIILKQFEDNAELIESRLNDTIEKVRKGNFDLEITIDGKAVCDAKITATLLNHDFRHGANIFMLGEFGEDEAAEQNYRERFAEAFNLATLPFYWSDLEPEQNKPRFDKDSPKIYRRPAPDLCLEFCKEHNIEPKAHILTYDYWVPKWVPTDDVDEIKGLYEIRYKQLADRYAQQIKGWEVINETLFTHGDTAFYYDDNYVEWCFEKAEEYFPNNTLIINEATESAWSRFIGNRSQYFMQIERAIANGSRIDCIGFQYHQFHKRELEEEKTKFTYNPLNLYANMDKYAQFQKHFQLTELTIPAYSNDEEDEAIQAEILTWLYKVWFSHPNMEAIIYWNLIDGYAAFAPKGDMTAGENYYFGGLLRFDGSPKPSYFAIRDLFKKTWHTRFEGKTNGDGRVNLRGFYGEYDVTVEVDGKVYSVKADLHKGRNKLKIEL